MPHLLELPWLFSAVQAVPPVGIDPFVWLVWLAVTGAIGKLYWDSRAESKRKDELIDRLLKAGLENAEANKLSVSLLEEEKRRSK